MPDCPASSQSGTAMKKNADAGTHPGKETFSGTGTRRPRPVPECSGKRLRRGLIMKTLVESGDSMDTRF